MPLKLPENRNFFMWLGLGWMSFGMLIMILSGSPKLNQIIIIIGIIIMCFHVFPWTQWLLKKLLDFINYLLDRRAGKR